MAELRLAAPEDTPAIVALLGEAQLPTEGVAELLRGAPGAFVVAEANGTLVAAGALEPAGTSALMRSVVVRDDLRATGVGRRVVERLLHEADCRGLDLYLLTTTADGWFPRFGFTRVNRADVPAEIAATWEFKTGCSQTAIAMRRLKPGTLNGAAP